MSRPITPNELKRLFPNASSSTARRNDHDHAAAVSSRPVTEPAGGLSLVGQARRKEASGCGAGERYHIHYAAYSVRPRDWDNLAASCKEIQDQIWRAGWLPDDGWRVLTGSVESCKAATDKDERTVVTITREA